MRLGHGQAGPQHQREINAFPRWALEPPPQPAPARRLLTLSLIHICAAISLGKDALTSAMPIIICAVAFVLCYFTSISNLTLVVAGVVIALVWMGVSEHGHV